MVDVKANFFGFGLALGLQALDLESIRKMHAQNVNQALMEVLLLWLRGKYNVSRFGQPTWHGLMKAIRSPAGGNNHALAKKIADKYLIKGSC